MSSSLLKVDSSDKWGKYLSDKLISSNGSIGFNVTDPLANGDKRLDIFASVGPYAIYAALLTQTSTNNPSVVVLANTLGVTIAWTRSTNGVYLGTASAAIFSASTTGCLIQASNIGTATENNIKRTSTSVVTVASYNTSKALTDGILSETLVNIIVYTNPPNVPPAASVTYVRTAIDYSVTASNKIVGVTNTAAVRTITLLAPASYPVGQLLTIKDESGSAAGNPIVVDGIIDSVNSWLIDANYGSVTIYSNGVDQYYVQATQ